MWECPSVGGAASRPTCARVPATQRRQTRVRLCWGQKVTLTPGSPHPVQPCLLQAYSSEILCPTSVNPAFWRNQTQGPFNVLVSKTSPFLSPSPTAGDKADVLDTMAVGSLGTCPAGEGRQEGLKQAEAHGKHGTVLEARVHQP